MNAAPLLRERTVRHIPPHSHIYVHVCLLVLHRTGPSTTCPSPLTHDVQCTSHEALTSTGDIAADGWSVLMTCNKGGEGGREGESVEREREREREVCWCEKMFRRYSIIYGKSTRITYVRGGISGARFHSTTRAAS